MLERLGHNGGYFSIPEIDVTTVWNFLTSYRERKNYFADALT